MFPIVITQGDRGNGTFSVCEKIFTNSEYNAM